MRINNNTDCVTAPSLSSLVFRHFQTITTNSYNINKATHASFDEASVHSSPCLNAEHPSSSNLSQHPNSLTLKPVTSFHALLFR